MDEDLYMATASATDARAALLPTRPSEDASSLLPKIQAPAVQRIEPPEYLPSTLSEWVLHVEFLGQQCLSASDIAPLFDTKWRTRYGGLMIYGRDANTGLWTFVSSTSPKSVTSLQFAWQYFPAWSDHPAVTSASMFRRRTTAVEKEMLTLTRVTTRSEVGPEDAHARSAFLADLSARLSRSIVLALEAPPGHTFDGKEIWDVMLCLGLRWGDMDCFHWDNRSGFGDQAFFSVWTSTDPGYFLPEEIAAGLVQTSDLIFGYSIPGSANPLAVFDAMQAAADYARKRLGGRVLTGDGLPPDRDSIRKEIQEIASEAGIQRVLAWQPRCIKIPLRQCNQDQTAGR